MQTSDTALPPGVSIDLSRTPVSPSPERRLLQDVSSDGVNMTVTITAPASDMSDLSDLVQQVVSSASVRRQLQEAGKLVMVQTYCLYLRSSL